MLKEDSMKRIKFAVLFLCITIVMTTVYFAAIGYRDSGSAVSAIQQKLGGMGYELVADGCR